MQILETQVSIFLQRIRESGVLGKGQRRAQLLEYIIRTELDGRGEKLKAYSIGLDVLGRSESFDPSTDSIVRVEIGRLRDALALFEASSFNDTQFIVQIPKGTYRPVFSERDQKLAPIQSGDSLPIIVKYLSKNWLGASLILGALLLVLAVLLTLFVLGKTDSQYGNEERLRIMLMSSFVDDETLSETEIPLRFMSELTKALTKNSALTIVRTKLRGDMPNVDYVLGAQFLGGVRPNLVSLELVDASTQIIVWADAFPVLEETGDQVVAKAVVLAVREVTPQILNHSKQALDDRDVEDLNAWELFLLATWVPGKAVSSLEWEKQRIELARRAIDLDPELGQAYSVLSDKLAYLSGVDANYYSVDLETQARQSAAKALALAPNSVGALFNVSIHKWHMGDIQDAISLSERVLEIDPSNGLARLLSVLYPYTCVLAPDSILNYAKEFDQSLSTDNPIRWVVLTWISKLHINRGEFELAELAESRSHIIFHTPDTVMRHAVTLHALGKSDEAVSLVDEQLTGWPNLDPTHFANVTLPRRCHEYLKSQRLLNLYSEFSKAYREQHQ